MITLAQDESVEVNLFDCLSDAEVLLHILEQAIFRHVISTEVLAEEGLPSG